MNKSHPAITKYRLMKEFGWTPSQLTELDSKQTEELLFIIKTVDAIIEDKIEAARRANANAN